MSRPTLGKLKYLKSETSPERLGPCAAEAALVGRSNVGKSSLINALGGEALARVSGTPGRTRAINVYADADRWLVDLPGYGYVQGAREERAGWGGMIEGYLTRRESLRMVFALVDAKVGATRLDLEMLRWLQGRGLPWRVVATKADQVKASRSAAQRREIASALGVQPERVFWVSAAENLGIGELRGEVAALLAG